MKSIENYEIGTAEHFLLWLKLQPKTHHVDHFGWDTCAVGVYAKEYLDGEDIRLVNNMTNYKSITGTSVDIVIGNMTSEEAPTYNRMVSYLDHLGFYNPAIDTSR